MNALTETKQAEDVPVVGDTVRIAEHGRPSVHERLHGATGKLASIDGEMACVRWEWVHMNSGSNERTAKNGPHVPRMRAATSVLPLASLERVP